MNGSSTAVVDAASSRNQAVLLGFEGELIVAVGRGRCQEGLVLMRGSSVRLLSRCPRDAAGEVRSIGSEVEHVSAEVSAQVNWFLRDALEFTLALVVEVIARPGKALSGLTNGLARTSM